MTDSGAGRIIAPYITAWNVLATFELRHPVYDCCCIEAYGHLQSVGKLFSPVEA